MQRFDIVGVVVILIDIAREREPDPCPGDAVGMADRRITQLKRLGVPSAERVLGRCFIFEIGGPGASHALDEFRIQARQQHRGYVRAGMLVDQFGQRRRAFFPDA